MGEALHITQQAIVKLGNHRFNKITQERLPEQIRSETLQIIQSRIEHNIYILN